MESQLTGECNISFVKCQTRTLSLSPIHRFNQTEYDAVNRRLGRVTFRSP